MAPWRYFKSNAQPACVPLGRNLDATVANWRDYAKDTALWNIEKGFALTADELLGSELKRSQIYANVAEFFENYDVLVLPGSAGTSFCH